MHTLYVPGKYCTSMNYCRSIIKNRTGFPHKLIPVRYTYSRLSVQYSPGNYNSQTFPTVHT